MESDEEKPKPTSDDEETKSKASARDSGSASDEEEDDDLPVEDEDDEDDDEKDKSGSSGQGKLSLTSFLFGNVDKNGELVDDFFDADTRRQIHSLDRMNIASNLMQEIKEDVKESFKASQVGAQTTSAKPTADGADDADYERKLDSAVDYSDITELADEMPEEDAKFRAALSELVFKMPSAPISKPPSAAQPAQSAAKKRVDEEEDDDYDSEEKPKEKPDKPKNQQDSSDSDGSDSREKENSDSANKKRLDTPLAAMLPRKYADCDVTDLFPEFRHTKTLRFSRLFGQGKASHQPNLWKNVRNKKKKRRRPDEPGAEGDLKPAMESPDDSDAEKGFRLRFGQTPAAEELMSDDEERLKRPLQASDRDEADQEGQGDSGAPKVADWRKGPAKLWYDMMGVPEAGKNFDYGFKLKPKTEHGASPPERDDEPDDCFHMVTQVPWEEEIIWNGDEVKQKVLAKNSEKYHSAGWVPSGLNRTATAFTQQVRGTSIPSFAQTKQSLQAVGSVAGKKNDKLKPDAGADADKDDTWYSMFPVENEELIYGLWEEEIIWDADALDRIPEPRILTLDPNDENIVLGIPDDIDPSAIKPKVAVPIPLKEKKEHHLKKSRILLGKAGVIAEPEPESPPPPEELEKDPFNISNDEYYNPKLTQDTALKPTVGGNLIQHSLPALELHPMFFPTHMGPVKLRCFHRPQLKRYSHGAVADCLSHGVIPLVKHMRKKTKQREQERLAAGGGDIFFMRTPEDVSGKDGELILCEYTEEHPPLMMQVGMATKIKNYYKRRAGKDGGAPKYEYGDTAYAHTSPFLGNLMPGQSIQAFENNLFRAPIYRHHLPETDFLVIRTRNNYFIRTVDTIFTVGQELPLFEVPGPNSKKANNFIRDFLQVFIYRLFWSSVDVPKRIKMEDIKKAFPSHSESSIRKRLKQCADFKRTGLDSNWWVLKPEFRLPTEDEMRAMVSPEQCCGYYSMSAAELRLKDAGYGEKTLFTAEDEDDDQLKMDDEVKTAPWHTTRAFIAAMKGKCLLQLNGVADPTGCGEGFSYVRIPNKPQISKEDNVKQQEPKKTVTGTDADLRRLPLSAAKNLLRKFNVPEEEIKKLSRWEVIDVVRTLSTAQAKQGAETMSKFARGNRFSIAEHQERYKEEAQRVFELQNRILGSIEELSTDEAESEEEDMDIEEMGKNIENIIANKKTNQQLTLEKEEEERRELRKLFMGEDSNAGDKKKKLGALKEAEEAEDAMNLASSQGKLLKIYRTYRSEKDGKEYVRIETVRKPGVIAAYVKIRQTTDPDYIRKFATAMDEEQKEGIRREKRRLQEQLRRLKRNQDKDRPGTKHRDGHSSFNLLEELGNESMYDDPMISARPLGTEKKQKKEKKEKEKKESKVKCSNCGLTGHMRSNRICPMYTGELPSAQAATAEREDRQEKGILEGDDLIKVDDTKLILSRSLFNHEDDVRKRALILKLPKELMRKKRRGTEEYCDYLEKPEYKAANRRRTDPLVSLSILLDQVSLELRQMEGTELFWMPVNAKKVKDYYTIVTRPMDLQTIRKKVREKTYRSREEFLVDVRQLQENSRLYNGPNNVLTAIAAKMVETAENLLQEKSDRLDSLEKAINPLLDVDQVAFSYIIECVVLQRLKTIPESWPFHQPVNKKFVKDYYEVIKTPVDLEKVLAKAKDHKYASRQAFLDDLELMHQNCNQFNGPESQFTKKALEILETGRQALQENEPRLVELEQSIHANREAALEAAGDDNESVLTGGLSIPDQDENSSLAETDARPDSRGAFSNKDDFELNSDYYDENSQSGLVINQEDQDRRMQQDDIQLRQMIIDNGEPDEIIDENYDPSEFLLEKFIKPVVMSEEDDEDDDDEDDDDEDDDDKKVGGQLEAKSGPSKSQVDGDSAQSGPFAGPSGLQQERPVAQPVDLRDDLAVSDSDEERMQIDGQAETKPDEPTEDDDDVWF